MHFDDLTLFLNLCQTLHFGNTSRACHVSPSTLSRIIQRLEEQTGRSLFDRDRRHVALTPAGVAFQTFAVSVIKNWDAMRSQLDEGSETLHGSLNLYCSVTASYSILPELLRQFRPQFPDVQINLTTGDASAAMDRVLDDSVDITIAALPDRVSQSLETRIITTTPLCFIAPIEGPVTEQLGKRIDWSQIPMIFPESGLIRTYLEKWFRQKGLRPRIYGQVSGHEAIISLVGLGFGVGVIPELVLEKSMIQTDVQRLDVKPALPDFRVGLCVKKSKRNLPVVRAFWQTLVNMGS
ncbi:MAG: HTH-type transcriptional activator IlvY [bacterium]|jgi:LysR family transcriptional regulator, positive regulator for ilvC|nr:HTH-type transcriptional activator IlvY [bacterium]